MNNSKYLEYYFDSKIYSNEAIQNSIDETKKEFPNKNVKVNVFLNKFGVYVITFKFENKNKYFNKIKILLKRKKSKRLMIEENREQNREQKELYRENKSLIRKEKEQKRFDKYLGENHYGQYKSNGCYRPY